jgi:hypothetical protein
MNPSSETILARAAFPENQHHSAAFGRARSQLERFAHGARTIPGHGRARLPQSCDFRPELPLAQDVFDGEKELLDLEGFGNVVSGAFAGVLDRRSDRAATCDDNELDVGVVLFELDHQITAVPVG